MVKFDLKMLRRKGLQILLFLAFSINCFSQKQCFVANDSKICYEIFGKGKPVLIINGGPGFSSEGFSELAQIIGTTNMAILYDQRGTGKSSLSEINAQRITIDLMLADIEALRKELSLESWTILGHSFGGMLAYSYASKFPSKVDAMIQSHSGGMDLGITGRANINNKLTPTQLDSLNYYRRKISNGDHSSETAYKRAWFLAHAYVVDHQYLRQVANRLTQINSDVNRLVWQDMQRIEFDTKKQMKNFEKPVLILHGQDEIAPADLAKNAHEILPNSKLVIMNECGHYGWLDRPEVYITEVQKFLKSI